MRPKRRSGGRKGRVKDEMSQVEKKNVCANSQPVAAVVTVVVVVEH